MTVAIDFELHQVVVDVDSLVTMRSSYYDDNQKWEELVHVGVTKDNCTEKLTKTFNRSATSPGLSILRL